MGEIISQLAKTGTPNAAMSAGQTTVFYDVRWPGKLRKRGNLLMILNWVADKVARGEKRGQHSQWGTQMDEPWAAAALG